MRYAILDRECRTVLIVDATSPDDAISTASVGDEYSTKPAECMDCQSTVDVRMRWPGYGDRMYPRCGRCGNARLERERENIRRYAPDGPGAPDGFDPMDAGECWDSE